MKVKQVPQLLTLCVYFHTINSLPGHFQHPGPNSAGAAHINSLLSNRFQRRTSASTNGRNGFTSRKQDNCTTNCNSKVIGLKLEELMHIQRLKDKIISKLGLKKDKRGNLQDVFDKPVPRDSNVPEKTTPAAVQPPSEYFPEFSEIISFSEKAGNVCHVYKNLKRFM